MQAHHNLMEMQARLDRLERHDWWRWALAFIVMLALTAGLFALSVPVGRDMLDQLQLNIGVRALLGLVLLFDVFVIHQQMLMKKLRRDLASQIGVINALESLSESDEPTGPRVERRRVRRSGLDRRLCVNSVHEGRPTAVFGRIRDISEVGLGAVIPCALLIGEEVTLEFSMEDMEEIEVKAVVRHRKSFHYGFEFVEVDPRLCMSIARFVAAAAAAGSRRV
jgi:PilZ domain